MGSGMRSRVDHEQVWSGAERPAANDTDVSSPLAWIEVPRDAPYFVTDRGEPWTPIGQNDSISWVELDGLFRNANHAAVERHLRWLAASGVTCLRLMLEYAQVRHRYFEKPAGIF